MELEVTRSIEEQLSAFLDGELSPEELALLVRRLERDESYRATLARYATIGGVMRSEPLLQGRNGLHTNVLDAIVSEHSASDIDSESLTVQASGTEPAAGLRNRGWMAVAAMAVLAVAGVYSSGLLNPLMQAPDARLASESVPETAAVAVVSDPVSQPAVQASPASVRPVARVPDTQATQPPVMPVRSPSVQLNRERMRSYLISHGEYARTFHGAMADSRMYVQQASFEE